ncbi:Lycopene beta-cyclase [Sporormia fimetaria CBS 119925]|uniref:Bifunctional lycopene cyclase/phytoene synthase n=1 Tax=Sporormia fimetaria CBS 119925 TaxID=1340428 RepID=A0A6A6UU30_9PLEO|nr:Lycopene beta-cyclase [Sporormia fimetaria CBS 119925]
MGFDYALVHLKYTIPPAVVLTALYRPLLTKLDAYKIGFLVTVAVISTIPWDSYLIRNQIWSYPSHVIIGHTLCDIPLEEVFFFFIQTYNTSLLYLILSRPTFQPRFLRAVRSSSHPKGAINPQWRYYRVIGQVALVAITAWGWHMVRDARLATYTGLIIVWAVPFLLFLWTLAYQFILGLPLTNTVLPIMLPTLYLWIVDTLALKRGTWVINDGTKLGIHLWVGLDIEEALFFFLTNAVIVCGQLAFDNALSILAAFPDLFPQRAPLPSPALLMRALLTPASRYDELRIVGLQEAVTRLRKKSRSFYLASSVFQTQIRTDLLLLYSFCRVADDLVDDASSSTEAKSWIAKMQHFLELAYNPEDGADDAAMKKFVTETFPAGTQTALLHLPVSKLSREPLEDLLRGFEMDMDFESGTSPIRTEADLDVYAHRVAGTVAHMCIELIFSDYNTTLAPQDQQTVVEAGDRMGIALQCVNIARDIAVDTKMNRVYIPDTWLAEANLTAADVLKDPSGPMVEKLRTRLLDKAFSLHRGAKDAIERLPVEASGPLRVAVESYMEIGRVLRQEGYIVKAGRATVPKSRRLRVAWNTLRER